MAAGRRRSDQRPPARPAASPDQRPSRTWLAVLHHLSGWSSGRCRSPGAGGRHRRGRAGADRRVGPADPRPDAALRRRAGGARAVAVRGHGRRRGPGLAGRPAPPVPLAGDPGPGRLHRPRHLGQDLLPAAAAARQRAAVPGRRRLLGRRPGHAPAHAAALPLAAPPAAGGALDRRGTPLRAARPTRRGGCRAAGAASAARSPRRRSPAASRPPTPALPGGCSRRPADLAARVTELEMQPRAGGGRGRGRAAADRARPARRRPAAPGRAGDGARPGQGEVRRRPRGGQGAPRPGARRGQGGADRAAEPGPRRAPADPDRARPRRGPVRPRRALPGPGRRAGRGAGQAEAGRRGGRVLHGRRGAHQRGQALPRQPRQRRGRGPRLPRHADRRWSATTASAGPTRTGPACPAWPTGSAASTASCRSSPRPAAPR